MFFKSGHIVQAYDDKKIEKNTHTLQLPVI